MMNEIRDIRTLRIYGDLECMREGCFSRKCGNDADITCANCFFSRVIEGVLHEKPYNVFTPNFLGFRFCENFIISNEEFAEWEVIRSEKTIPHIPYDIFYNGTFCRVEHIKETNVYHQTRLDDEYDYYAIFKLVREGTFERIKNYVKENPVQQFSHAMIAVNDADEKIYCVLVVVNKCECYEDLDLVIQYH